MILKSIFFGKEGSYDFYFTRVNFKNTNRKYLLKIDNTAHFILKAINFCSYNCLKSRIFKIMTFGYLHIFIHEFGHALTDHILNGSNCEINIDITEDSPLNGYTTSHGGRYLSFSDTAVNLAGPLTNTLFCASTLVATKNFREYLPRPISVVLIMSSAIWMCGELTYAGVSAINKDKGDFGRLVNKGAFHLLISLVLLVGMCVLTIFYILH